VGLRLVLKNIVCHLTFVFLLFVGTTASYAVTCNLESTEGFNIPNKAREIITKGYNKVSIKSILGVKYLVLTNEHDINKCSILFKIDGQVIETIPVIGAKEQICNITIRHDKIVSSWRDSGEWNDDVYQVSLEGKWTLLFRDSCVGCDQIKRTYFSNGDAKDTVLFTNGSDFSVRKVLTGQILVDKANLYKTPNFDMKTNFYLIRGNNITLTDMSKNGEFYKMEYRTSSGKKIISWIESDAFLFE
jgi:hypothetical protein